MRALERRRRADLIAQAAGLRASIEDREDDDPHTRQSRADYDSEEDVSAGRERFRLLDIDV